MSARTCVSHCPVCRSHFAGDGAFDRHRAGPFDRDEPGSGGRYCKDPAEDPWFESVTGECRICIPGSPLTEITIWRRAGAAERLRRFD